ncbi:hypothetical protein CKM354_000110700 [Cercospora kikuchii]|uniref:Cupin type-1 domain-containing protein n=1 Tax=Cercospora kikuchii TaxID=84275 RepID=A0A9P3FCM1_9PEZI|nr:uncharacterized protein CKM354_000110700 [Cercospora kikuchii]GIZ37665.1 hypothetical protein CKM354_000110700 [Cercospora kikuchii]
MRLSQIYVGAVLLGAAAATPVIARDEPQVEAHKEAFKFKRGLPSTTESKHLRPNLETRQEQPINTEPETNAAGYSSGSFAQGQPVNDANGRGAPILGGTNRGVDIQNPSNLGQEPTDAGVVPNLKWRFSDSKTRLLKGGWVREQVVQDLPQSRDIAGAQQHLKKGAVRELHWHKVAEWGFVYSGRIGVSAVDEDGRNSYDVLGVGDVWYFPKGAAHTVHGLSDEAEYLLVFDEGDFDAFGTTFNVDDWISHTPKDVLAKNFGVNASLFDTVPSPNPYIQAGNQSLAAETEGIEYPVGDLSANASSTYVRFAKDVPVIQAPGGGGTIQIFDSRNFPISTTIASSIVTIKPGGLRELHWHPTAEEWVYFAQGQARATVFMGSGAARTFDFFAGDTAVFPDNSGHYVENTSETEDLIWIEIFKADRVADISLTQWLALTPAPLVAQVLNISIDAVKGLKKEKQLIIA